jgi:hypothetical protein
MQINERLTYQGAQALVERYDAIVSDVLTRVEKDGLVLSSFARLLMARAQEIERAAPPLVYIDATDDVARERAAAISRAWSIHVDGRSLGELRAMLKDDRPPGKILTNYYRHSQVLALAGPKGIPVIPIGLSYSRAMAERIEQLPPRARLLLIFDEADRARAGLMLDDYRRRFNRSDIRFEGRAFPGVRGLRRLAIGRAYALVVVSVRVWDRIPDDLKALPRVMRTDMEFAPAQLEEARIAAEVVL